MYNILKGYLNCYGNTSCNTCKSREMHPTSKTRFTFYINIKFRVLNQQLAHAAVKASVVVQRQENNEFSEVMRRHGGRSIQSAGPVVVQKGFEQ